MWDRNSAWRESVIKLIKITTANDSQAKHRNIPLFSRYEYIALLDIDEVIMPLKHDNWADMMEEVIKGSLKIKNETRASWNFRNVYFMDEMLDIHEPDHFSDIPDYLHMMQHV